ncbi:hypothetical protein TcasGA2_TC000288 [Tribolium castaneum]|uniref:Protein TsetseEP domain-containing protein n=1 Tax=Tribolium castaneum TaxID=7070 RepID=D6WBC2_TRICA|nr:PREDICTED: uncharacterized protein LOC660577 [Tribolium castaneum]EEZ97903.1 hypothetical protein TcasGA2_TC000288 [Tribolium castaneum]|eukprot:XP_976015.1 PREDICTED: uncharacterized protein LOC660577 [Tribolium castaneum]
MALQLVLLCALFALANAGHFAPRDLIDEATRQLEELKQIVHGDILVAHNDLSDAAMAFNTYADTILKQSVISIQQEAETIHSQLETIKELGHAAGKDISSCTKVREPFLRRLPGHYTESIVKCTHGLMGEAGGIAKNAKYIVDITINQVHRLEHELANCKGEILCISPLLTEIELGKIRLPQNIKTEVQATQSVLTTLKISAQSCGDDHVAEYTTEATTILGDITACVDRIIP